MTVALLSKWGDQPAGTLFTSDAATEAAMIANKQASATLTGAVVWDVPAGIDATKNRFKKDLKNTIAKVLSGSGRATWLFMGDSTTAGPTRPVSHPVVLAKILKSMGVNTQTGMMWGSAYYGNLASFIAWDSRLTAGAGWGQNGSMTLAGKFYQNTTDLTAFTFTPTEAFNQIEIWYYQNTGNATFTVDVGGAALQTVNSSGSMAVVKVAVPTGAGAAVQSVNINRTGVGAGCYILGINTYDSAAPAIEMHQAGWATSQTSDWIIDSSPFSPLKMIALINPELTFINLGVNDSNGGTPIATYISRYQKIIDKLKAAGSDIILCGFVQSDPGAFASLSVFNDYQIAVKSLAEKNNLLFISFSEVIGLYAEANTAGYMVDQRHPSNKGCAALAQAKADLLSDIRK